MSPSQVLKRPPSLSTSFFLSTSRLHHRSSSSLVVLPPPFLPRSSPLLVLCLSCTPSPSRLLLPRSSSREVTSFHCCLPSTLPAHTPFRYLTSSGSCFCGLRQLGATATHLSSLPPCAGLRWSSDHWLPAGGMQERLVAVADRAVVELQSQRSLELRFAEWAGLVSAKGQQWSDGGSQSKCSGLFVATGTSTFGETNTNTLRVSLLLPLLPLTLLLTSNFLLIFAFSCFSYVFFLMSSSLCLLPYVFFLMSSSSCLLPYVPFPMSSSLCSFS